MTVFNKGEILGEPHLHYLRFIFELINLQRGLNKAGDFFIDLLAPQKRASFDGLVAKCIWNELLLSVVHYSV